MDWQLRLIALPLLAGALSMGLVAVLALRARAPGRVPLILLSLAFAVYDVGYALELGAARVEDVRAYLKLQYLGVANLPALVLFVALLHTGVSRLVRPLAVVLTCLIPAATCVLAFTNEAHELVWRNLSIDPSGPYTRTYFERGYWYWVHNGYSYLLLGGAVVLIAVELSRARGLYRRQLKVLLLATAIPIATHGLYLMTPLFEGLDPNPYALSLTALLLAWGMLDARLWDVVPIAREAVLAGVADPVLVIDRQGRIADLNPALEGLVGRPAAQLLGRPAEELFPDWAGPIGLARSGVEQSREASFAPAGQMRHFDAGFTPLALAPGSFGVVVLLHDVSERVEAQLLKQALARTMVHDLRNPLTAVHGALELLEDETRGLGPKARDLVELGRQGTDRLLEVVNAILDVERLRSGKLQLDRSEVDVGELAGEAVRLQRSLAAGKQQRLELELPDALPPVAADRALVSRVLQNLIGNAVKFTPRGGHIRIGARADGQQRFVELVVSDDGPGVPAKLHGRLFGEFVSGEVAGSGSGLGLAFCRLVVEAHGGQIGLDSGEPGRGASFRFTLPCASG